MLENVSADLESFAKYDFPSSSSDVRVGILTLHNRHAGRSTVSTDDVMLLSRRNEGLETVLKNCFDKQKSGNAKCTTR